MIPAENPLVLVRSFGGEHHDGAVTAGDEGLGRTEGADDVVAAVVSTTVTLA